MNELPTDFDGGTCRVTEHSLRCSVDKTHILNEIRRTTAENDGMPLGKQRFETVTGIKRAEWWGLHWARWSDAVAEAGFAPNKKQVAFDREQLLEQYAEFSLELGRLPAKGDLRIKTRRDPNFPHETTFRMRFETKVNLVRELVSRFGYRESHSALVSWCGDYLARHETKEGKVVGVAKVELGFVYLLKHGSRREYKIGRTNNLLRREGEVGIELPLSLAPIHSIQTDDPAGVEAYWHRRFASKRLKNEWFALTSDDVRAFKRWRRIS